MVKIGGRKGLMVKVCGRKRALLRWTGACLSLIFLAWKHVTERADDLHHGTRLEAPLLLSLLLSSLELTQMSMSLKYEPAWEPRHIYVT